MSSLEKLTYQLTHFRSTAPCDHDWRIYDVAPLFARGNAHQTRYRSRERLADPWLVESPRIAIIDQERSVFPMRAECRIILMQSFSSYTGVSWMLVHTLNLFFCPSMWHVCVWKGEKERKRESVLRILAGRCSTIIEVSHAFFLRRFICDFARIGRLWLPLD